MNRTQTHRGPEFELHALPEAAGLDVPVLLAMRDFRVAQIADGVGFRARVGDAHCKLVDARADERRDIDFEGEIAAVMAAGFKSVHINFRTVIHGAESKEEDLAWLGSFELYRPPIPRNARVITQIVEVGL